MPLLVADVIDNARDMHPLLSKVNAPDPLLVRELTRAVSDLYDQIYPRVPAYLAVTLDVDLTDPAFNWDAAMTDAPGFSPPNAIDLTTLIAGGWKDITQGEFWIGSGAGARGPFPAKFIPWEQRILARGGGRARNFTLRDNLLYFMGCQIALNQFTVFRLIYTPNPADLTLGGTVPLPLDAREPLASRLAAFALFRLIGNPQFKLTVNDIAPIAQRASSERKEFLTAIFRITQRQRYVMRDVMPDPGGAFNPGDLMTVEIERRGMVRPITDLPPLIAGVSTHLEVERDGKFYKALPTDIASVPNTIDIFTGYTAFQMPFLTDFVDVTGHLPAATATNVTIVGGRASFSGAGSKLVYVTSAAPAVNVLSMGVQSFTFEGWFQTSDTGTIDMVSKTNASLNGGCWILVMNVTSNSGLLSLYVGDFSSSTQLVITTAVKFNDGVRHHLRIVRSGSRWTIYVDGIFRGRGTSNVEVSDNVSPPDLVFGNSSFTRPMTGFWDNVRWITGLALNTVDFTVPTPPFPVS